MERKTTSAESLTEGAKRIVKFVWPKSGNNTEARRSEKPQTKTDREIESAEEGKGK